MKIALRLSFVFLVMFQSISCATKTDEEIVQEIRALVVADKVRLAKEHEAVAAVFDYLDTEKPDRRDSDGYIFRGQANELTLDGKDYWILHIYCNYATDCGLEIIVEKSNSKVLGFYWKTLASLDLKKEKRCTTKAKPHAQPSNRCAML